MTAWTILIISVVAMVGGWIFSQTGNGRGGDGVFNFVIGMCILAAGAIAFIASLAIALFH